MASDHHEPAPPIFARLNTELSPRSNILKRSCLSFVAKPKANGLNQTHETVVGEGEKLVEQRMNPFLILSINL